MNNINNWERFNENLNNIDQLKIDFVEYVSSLESFKNLNNHFDEQKNIDNEQDYIFSLYDKLKINIKDEELSRKYDTLFNDVTYIIYGEHGNPDDPYREFHIYENGKFKEPSEEQEKFLHDFELNDEEDYFLEFESIAVFNYEKWSEGYSSIKSLHESNIELLKEWTGTIGNVGNLYIKPNEKGGLIFLKGSNQILNLSKNDVSKLYRILKNFL